MPGLSQLKQFSSDLLAVGDEVSTRASRGEQPLKVEIPKSVQDINDSEEFVLGMPEVEAEVEDELIDEDLSDLAGITGSTSGDEAAGEEDTGISFEAPDMSGLLNPISSGDFVGDDIPDLSMFADEPEPVEEEIVEEEPEEVSIADMNLEDLLSGGGFDQPEESEEETVPEPAENKESVADSMAAENANDGLFGDLLGDNNGNDNFSEPESNLEPVGNDGLVNDLEDFDNLDEVGDLDDLGDFEDVAAGDEKKSEEPVEDFLAPEPATEIPEADEVKEGDNFDFEEPSDFKDIPESHDEINNFDIPSGNEDFSVPEGDFAPPSADESIPDLADMPDFTEPIADMDFDLDSAEDSVNDNQPGDSGEADVSDLDSFELPEEDSVGSTESEEKPEKSDDNIEDLGLGDFDDLNLPDMDEAIDDALPVSDDSSSENILDTLPELDDIGESPATEDADEFASAVPDGLFDLNDLDTVPGDSVAGDFSDEENKSSVDTDSKDSVEPLEVFDTSEMEGLDFDIPDTDTQLSQSADDDSEFDLKSDEEFGAEFEIPGFSDVETVKEHKGSKIGGKASGKEKKHKGKKQKTGGVKEENEAELPPNTLSDRQYKIFKKNLSEYPLNVRLAFEDFLVQDEFTDDAEFEVIEKILNKAPARQVANTLEKMLDISIPVPRDFEHRSAEEYEEYKKSISYQLKNKIIPAALVFVVGVFVCIGLFNFVKNCIYKPLRANSLYKQGYVLLQESEYPLSEIKFNQATTYKLNKKWFFNYARGYREHKQYQRAAKMYENILYCFKHDKKAGLEYADMELDDLANYARAEEIVRRDVLDYHINDPEGILKLGDVFLEWGTEKDPEKLELAREQYATLIQLYGDKDLYLSRMMRYFIRSDNLREVLQLKMHFEPKESSLCSDDWTELGGYLLDKYYGELAPSEEYLRYEIEGLRNLLLRGVKTNPENPIALYNLARYFINTNENGAIEPTLQSSIEKFNATKKMKKRDIYKYIDAYRLLGEHYMKTEDFLQAQEQLAEGISLYITERDNAGFEGTPKVGKLYEDLGDLKYSISGDYDEALQNYSYSVNLGNDSPRIRYRIGYVQYHNKNYAEALGSFMRAGDGKVKERNLLLAMANTLSLRGDDYAAEGYYNQLIETLDSQIAEKGLILPQANIKDYDIVNTYLSAANNYGVTLYRLAKKTGNSGKNAEAIVQFSQSIRAWDALTRNQETLVRLPGSNLAEQNIKYITHPIPEFEPAIYTNIPKTLLDNEKL